MKHFLLLLSFFAFQLSLNLSAQISVNNSQTPAQLIQSVFVGPGVVVSNVTYNGSAAAANIPQANVSEFTSSNGFVYGNGLLITTGLSAAAVGPNNAPGFWQSGTPNVSYDQDLNAIMNGNVLNGCVLEFDFVSTDNIVQMNYMFGSEEYPEYVGSAFNDAFGFFLSGPGITGPYQNGAVNLALIPNTNTPVTVNTVNGSTNSGYFLNNINGAAHGPEIQYDGTTTNLTAIRNIQCNAVYHIKLAIANVQDEYWDSGVFFQAGSFMTVSPYAIDISFSDDGIIYEGCNEGELLLTRTALNSIDPLTINYNVLGTAQINDHSSILSSVSFAAGQTQISLPIVPFEDDVIEGTETIIIEYSYLNACGDPVIDYDTLFINDGLVADAGSDISYCIGDSSQLLGVVSGGTIAWTSTEINGQLNTLNPYVLSSNSGMYILTVTNEIGCEKSDSAFVTALQQPIADFTFSNNCHGFSSLFTDVSSIDVGSTIISWNWLFEDGDVSSVQSPIKTFTDDGNYNVQLVVVSNSGCSDTVENEITIYPKPVASFTIQNTCLGELSQFTNTSNVTAPDEITNWNWIFGDNQISVLENPNHSFVSDNQFSNELIVTTNNGCKDTVVEVNTVWPLPIIGFDYNDTCFQNAITFINNSTISNLNTTNALSSWLWTFGDGNSSSLQSPSRNYLNPGTFIVELKGTSNHGCVDSLEHSVVVFPKPISNFSVDPVCVNLPSSFIDMSSVSAGAIISNWEWSFGDNTNSSVQSPTHVYASENIYSTQLIVTTDDNCKDTLVVPVSVFPRPILDFTALNVCQGFQTQFIDSVIVSNLNTTNSISSIEYDFSDGTFSNLSNVSHLYQNDGTYNVQLSAISNNGCADSIQHLVTVHPKPNASFGGADLTGCSSICPIITSTSSINTPGVITSYKWVYSDGFTDNGLFTSRCFENVTDVTDNYGITLYIVSDQECRDTIVSALNYISVYHNPIANFNYSPIAPDLIHNQVELENTSLNANSYEWQIENLFSSTEVNPSFEMPFEPSSYEVQLIANTLNNCSDTMTKTITVKDVVIVHVPNTFTPNGDDFNSTFKPVIGAGVDIYHYGFYIYNRWGEMVFESHNADFGWNGDYGNDQSQTGTYAWELEFKAQSTGENKRMSGHVNLIK